MPLLMGVATWNLTSCERLSSRAKRLYRRAGLCKSVPARSAHWRPKTSSGKVLACTGRLSILTICCRTTSLATTSAVIDVGILKALAL